MKAHITAICIVVLLCAAGALAQEPALYLGALEDVPPMTTEGSYHFSVRTAFYKQETEWKSFPTCEEQSCLKTPSSRYPAEVHWNVAFDGRKLGSITSHVPGSYDWYALDGLQDITDGRIPKVGQRLDKFGGFLGMPVFRPLVVTSGKKLADPEHWKAADLPTSILTILRKEFRRKYPKVVKCLGEDRTEVQPWQYGEDDIQLVKTYSSKHGWYIARIQLKDDGCGGPAEDSAMDQWFAISPKGDVEFLDSGMWLVDAGDYDGDGKSELVFAIDRYNRGGYELFYDNFTKHATFEYSYH